MKLRNILLMLLFSCAAFATAKDNVVTVKTARQFIEAIGPDRTIVIDSKTPLNITEAITELVEAGRLAEGLTYYSLDPSEFPLSPAPDGALDYVTYYDNFDGPGLQVRNCTGLTIRAKKDKAKLIATPRYSNVLEFIDCDNLKLDHLILGHTEEGYCDKGVIEFDGCTGFDVSDCEFYGCGTEGFVFESCYGGDIRNSAVYDCTYHTMHVKGSTDIHFTDCRFFNNREYDQINVYGCESIVFNHCAFDNLQGELFSMNDYTQFYNCVFHDCQIDPITSEFASSDYAILRHCSSAYGGTAPEVSKTKPQFRTGRYVNGTDTYVARLRNDYCLVLENEEGPEGFAVVCIDPISNDYETASTAGLINLTGILGARFVEKSGQYFLVLLDDGGEPLSNFVYIGK